MFFLLFSKMKTMTFYIFGVVELLHNAQVFSNAVWEIMQYRCWLAVI